MRQTGQASVEWLLLALTLLAIIWFSERQLSLLTELRELGAGVIAHFHFILNYVAIVPMGGL